MNSLTFLPVSLSSFLFRRLSSLVRRLSSVIRLLLSVVRHPSSVVCLRTAFTLVELMVVVAVIALLLMMLLPNIHTARERAWSSNCQNNLRQYAIGMNQYMTDNSGFFIHPGRGVGGAVNGAGLEGQEVGDLGQFDNNLLVGQTVGGAAAGTWQNMIAQYVAATVKLDRLSAGESSVRVCPVVQRALHDKNYFDPRLNNDCKGSGKYYDTHIGQEVPIGDFESSDGSGYDQAGNLLPDSYLDPAFTTYAINWAYIGQNKKDIPENVVAFIDWNAREGWWATLYWTNSSGYPIWKFNGTDSKGSAVSQDSPKWTNAWWLTEVGFHHRMGPDYGANYVAMDGHIGWISSNAITITNFTGQ